MDNEAIEAIIQNQIDAIYELEGFPTDPQERINALQELINESEEDLKGYPHATYATTSLLKYTITLEQAKISKQD